MRKHLGRLAAAVVSGALITLTVAPAALAEGESTEITTTSTSSAAAETTESSAPSSSAAETTSETTSSATSTTSEQPPVTSSSGAAASSTTPPGTTESNEPTSTSSSSSKPEEPPYTDDVAYGVDLGDGKGVLIIACASGQPTDVWSPDFDVVDGPYQEEQDGRYWDYLVQLHEGKSFDSGDVTADWTCASAPQGGGASSGGVAPVPGSGDAGTWQQSNGGDAQVSFAPKQGVETGFGGTARF